MGELIVNGAPSIRYMNKWFVANYLISNDDKLIPMMINGAH